MLRRSSSSCAELTPLSNVSLPFAIFKGVNDLCNLPPVLQKALDDSDEEDVRVTVVSYERTENGLTCKLEINIDEFFTNHKVRQIWKVHAIDVQRAVVSFESGLSIQILQDHPLLWEFKEGCLELYFRGICEDKPRLMHDLYNVHRSFYGNLEPFKLSERSFNHKPTFNYSNGLLAYGPKTLMEAYSECLYQHGMSGSIVGEIDHTCITDDSKILLFEPSYIIARNVEFSLVQ